MVYRPIIRTLTGALCGMDVQVSEQAGSQNIDFDLRMLEEICIEQRNGEQEGKKLLPVSVHFSVDDFFDETLLEKVEQIVTGYFVPRDMIIIVVNASMITGDVDMFCQMVSRFKEGGYQIWIDDLWKNFSLLNHTQDSPFAAVRVDMRTVPFARKQSKEMLSAAVQLAKRLGMQTIADAVETQEQYQFLREIGCEKIQGDYFPQFPSIQMLMADIHNRQVDIEYRADRHYYDQITREELVTDRPMAIVEFDQKDFRFLYYNQAFVQEGKSFGFDRDDFIAYMLNDPSSTLSRKFRYLQTFTKVGKEYAEMEFSIFGKYFRLKSRKICENGILTANQVEFISLAETDESAKRQQLDNIFRMMYSMYDVVFLRREDGKFENILRSSLDGSEDNVQKLEDEEIIVSEEKVLSYIYPGDRAEFAAFSSITGLKERLKKTKRGYEIRYFRSRHQAKGYVWKAHTLQYIPEMDMILYSTRPAPLDQPGLLEKLAPENLEGSKNHTEYLLGRNLREASSIGLFWKDLDRKFLGVNKRYLEIFGVEEEELIGRRVEEFPWFVSDFNLQGDEEKVLKEGVSLVNIVEKRIIDGETHMVLVSKEPMYKDAEIIGLVGSVVDIDSFMQEQMGNENTKDWLTGLLSPNGMLNIVSWYVEGWNIRRENFVVLRIEFLEHMQNYREYSLEISNIIAKKAAETLKKACNNRAVISRLYAGNYSLLMRCAKTDSVYEMIQDIRDSFDRIHEVDGYNVSYYPQFTLYFADQTQHISELIAVATGGSEEDLAARRKLEDKLNYYNLQLETVVDAIPGGIAMYEVVDQEVQLVYASSGVGAITGRTAEQFRMESMKDYNLSIHPKDIELVQTTTMEAVKKNQEINLTYRLIHTNGSIIWVNMRGRIVGMQDGHPLLLIVFRNMSETSVIYESILDEAQAGVLVSALADGEILYANKSVQTASQKLTDGSITALYQKIRSLCKKEKMTGQDNSIDKQRYEIELDGRNLLIYFVNGTWNGRGACICYISDITAKYIEEREKAMRESLLYLQAINASYDQLITFNLSKDQYTMRRGRNFLGFDWSHYSSYSELIAEVRKFFPEEEQGIMDNYIPARQIAGYQSGVMYMDKEHRIYDSSGQIHWVTDRVVYAKDPANGDIMGISLSMLIDDRVKDRNEQKEALQNALHDALEANRAKSRFLSNMSHDIRTPMNAVMGYTAIAAEHVHDAALVKECLDKILISGNHLQELINDVLDMSRIEAGQECVKLTEASWDTFLTDIEAIAQPLARMKEIDLVVDDRELEHRFVQMDVSKMRRAVVNVLGNAIKFTDSWGKVRCKITETPASKAGYGTYTITIEDNGIGMSAGYLEHIFEAFSREKTSTESRVTGTGLGMAITKKYMEMMDGQIVVQSVEGEGTVVTLTVELAYRQPEQPQQVPAEAGEWNQLANKRVLVVDDSDLNRDIVCMMLADYGVITDSAVNGWEAVCKLTDAPDNTYDYVLMDMRMPVMDGIEATRAIRASDRRYLQQVPIIAVSANAFQEDVHCCLEAGMNAHLSKPFNVEHLINILKQYERE